MSSSSLSDGSGMSSLNSSMDSLQVGQQGASHAASSAGSAASIIADPTPFTSFNRLCTNLPGFDKKLGRNLKLDLRKKEKALGSQHNLEHFELARAAVRPGGRHIAVGTDSPEASQHFLSIIDVEVMRKSARDDPVVCYTRLSEHISDVKWLNAETLLCATGRGNLKLFQFDSAAKTVKHIGDMIDAAASYIREVAVQPGTANSVAMGGFDQKLNILDLNRPDAPYVQRLDMQGVIGSVKWAPFHDRSYVSCGLDEGKFYLFDTRSKISEAAFYIDTRKEDLFAHERYSDFGVMLGFGDGLIQHLDMRQANKVLHDVQDPFVEAIGSIEWDREADAFIVSGYTDFTVWNAKGGIPAVHSHGLSSEKVTRGAGYACSAVWYDSKTVLSSDNDGEVGLFLQDFE